MQITTSPALALPKMYYVDIARLDLHSFARACVRACVRARARACVRKILIIKIITQHARARGHTHTHTHTQILSKAWSYFSAK